MINGIIALPEGLDPVKVTSAAMVWLKIVAGICVGLLSGYVSYHSACGPAAGTFWFWLQAPLLRKAVLAWALLGSALGLLVPI